MKIIRLVVGIFVAGFLFGCTSLQDKELSSQREVIQSFFIANNKIYAIGQLNSYSFNGSRYSQAENLIRILQSPYLKNISSVELHSIAKNIETKKVKSTLTLYFNDEELDRNELLNKAKLIQPLETKYSEYRQEKRYSSQRTKDNFTIAERASATAVILIPLAIISLPFYAIQSLSGK